MAARKAETIFVGDAASIVRAAKQADAAVGSSAKGIQSAHEKVSSSASKASRETIGFHQKIGGSFVNMSKRAGEAAIAIGAAYASIEGVKKSISAVSSLTEATVKLTKTTGLSVQQASAYAAVAKVNDISSQKLSQSFGQLAKNVKAVTDVHAGLTTSAKTQTLAFKQLGIPVAQLVKDHGDMNLILQQVTKRFTDMPAGVTKTGVAMALFGRGWQTLVPLMKKGELGLTAQLQAAKDMGATLGGKTVDSLEQYQAAQNKAKLATLGMQLAIGQYLAPAITKIINIFTGFIAGIRNGTGEGGKFRDVVLDIAHAVGPTLVAIFTKTKAAVAGFVQGIRDGTGAGGEFATVVTTMVADVKIAAAAAVVAFTTVETAVSGWISKNKPEIQQFGFAVKNFATDVYNVFKAVLVPVFDFLLQVVKRTFPAIEQIVGGTLSAINGVIKIFTGVFTGDWGKAWDGVKNIVTGTLSVIIGSIRAFTAPVRQIMVDLFGVIKTAVGKVVSFVLGGFSSMIGVFKSFFDAVNIKLPIVGHIFGAAGGAISKALGNAQDSIDNFRQQFDPTTKAAESSTDAIASAHEAMAKRVKAALAGTTAATGKGIVSIDDQLASEMRKIGIPIGTIINVAGNQAGSAIAGVGSRVGKAGGGLVQIGRPGDAGHDSVPLNVGGAPISVAPGEQVAVFNRHQLPIVNAALGKMGGLRGLFSKVKTPHYMASGGTLSYGQLEGLWDSAGGPKGVDSTAAAIALAESGGRDVMQQGQPFATTGWGYWQITPGGPQYLNPMTNARAAVAKYRGAGDSFRPWTTFNDGAYKGFLQGGVGAVGGAAAKLKTPAWTGPGGALGLIGKGVLKAATKGANIVLNRAGSSAVGGVGGGATSGPNGLASFEGVTMSKWIANELTWATKHGWHGQPTSGYRPGFDPHAPDGSEHALIDYPGGAVDFGGMTGDPAAYATKVALVNLAARLNYPGPRLKMPIGFTDDGHLSGTGHAGGGFVGSFKNGGVVPRTGMALVHKDETIVPAFASGGLLYPLDAAIAALTARLTGLQNQNPGHPNEINRLQSQVTGLNSERSNLGKGAKNDARRAQLAAQTLSIETKIKALKSDDSAAKAALSTQIKNVTVQAAQLTQLNTFKTTIATLKSNVKDLAQQAAQAWNALQQTKINAAHDAAVAAINNGPLAQQLAGEQAQDAAEQNATQLATLNQNITDAQTLANNSGGQTHLDALTQLQQAQQALTDYQRQQDETRLQDQINSATSAADATQQTALAGLDQQTTDYQNSLDAQFGILTNQLNARKITYAQWASDVNGILASYGLSVATDPTTEAAVTAGPGAAAKGPAKKPTIQSKIKSGHSSWFGGARAAGGPVAAGLVYRVGEQGPEDVVFGRSGTVMTAAQTRRAGGGGDVHIHGDLNVNSHRAAKTMADRLAFRMLVGAA